jgi:NMD protein affecting ribosome stability and mRNA decay
LSKEDELSQQEDTQDIEGEPIYVCLDCGSVTIRGKWSMEGASTLAEAAWMLRAYAHELEQMRASGLELVSPVEGDYGIVRPGGASSDDDLDKKDDDE